MGKLAAASGVRLWPRKEPSFTLPAVRWLMLSAAYPENFNSFALFPKTQAWLAKWCKRSPKRVRRGSSGVLQRQNSNSRVFV